MLRQIIQYAINQWLIPYKKVNDVINKNSLSTLTFLLIKITNFNVNLNARKMY